MTEIFAPAPPAASALPWLLRLREKFAFSVLRKLLGALRFGRLTVILPSGESLEAAGAEPGPEGELRLANFRALRRMMAKGDIGFAEGFVAGDWSSPDLTALLRLAARNAPYLGAQAWGGRLHQLVNRLRHGARQNSRRGSRRNILDHYDLGNDFFALWLDESMLYSSGLYAPGVDSLAGAQARKLDAIVDLLGAPPQAEILEIGCGWGALAERLAQDGAKKILGLTLSPSQLDFARARLARHNLDSIVELRLQDYRDVSGQFDRVVSIEMIEAVGEKFWPAYFATLAQSLKPGGKALIQAITIDEARFDAYCARPDFIQRHIFPGGFLPTRQAIADQAAGAGLSLVAQQNFGLSYAATLAAWRENFLARWDQIAAQGFDEAFKRLWLYYLCYCEAGFREKATDVGFYLLKKPKAAPHAATGAAK